MTFEKQKNVTDYSLTRTGCGSCGSCSGTTGASNNQSNFGAQHSAQRENKGC